MPKQILQKFYQESPKYFVDRLLTHRKERMSRTIIADYLKTNDVTKLQIGCGTNILEGWLNTDLYFSKNAVAYLDAGKPFPFPDAAFDFIYSEHMFEHLKFAQGMNMLGECFRVLKPGGDIRLATPDLGFLIKLYSEPDSELHERYIRWATDTFVPEVSEYFKDEKYSAAFVVNNFFRDWGHEVLYNYQGLESLQRKHGFIEIAQKEVGESEIALFKSLEKHGEIIPSEFNTLETIVVEAKKPA